MKNKGFLLIVVLLSIVFSFSWKHFTCKHEETSKELVIHEDFSKDGMVEIRCSKCNRVIETEMIDQHKDNQTEVVVFPSAERRKLT